MSKDLMFYEKCPICNSDLQVQGNEDGFVEDWFCSKCSISWSLEDLEHEPIQKNLEKWF